MNARTGIVVIGAIALTLTTGIVVVTGGRLPGVLGQTGDEYMAPQPSDGNAGVLAANVAQERSTESRQAEESGRSFEVVTRVRKDGIAAIFDPKFVTADEAKARTGDNEPVIGLSINGDHRAYSVPFLSKREVVNDVVGGVPVAVTWCPLCFTGIVYAREVEGRELTFGVSGKLIMNALVIYDRETDTLWSQFLGEAVEGPLAGSKLKLIPSQFITWAGWQEQHPDTLVLDAWTSAALTMPLGGGAPDKYPDLTGLEPAPPDRTYDPYMGYYWNGKAGVYGETHTDERLRSKDLVIGIVSERSQRAYPYRHLAESLVINDSFEGRDLVLALKMEQHATAFHDLAVILNESNGAPAVFDRSLDGRTLTFDPADGPLLMTDRETGSSWDKTTGWAVGGTLKGKQLQQVPFFVSFWFAWTDFYPESELYDDLLARRK